MYKLQNFKDKLNSFQKLKHIQLNIIKVKLMKNILIDFHYNLNMLQLLINNSILINKN